MSEQKDEEETEYSDIEDQPIENDVYDDEEVNIEKQNKALGKRYDFFVDKDEVAESILGTGMLKNFIADSSIENGFAIASEKRVYYKGNCYYRENNKWKHSYKEGVLDLKDITSTGFETIINSGDIILAIFSTVMAIIMAVAASNNTNYGLAAIAVIFGILACIMLIAYFVTVKTLFSIKYAGGDISFNVKWFRGNEIESFQQKLIQLKDKYVQAIKIKDTKPVQADSQSITDQIAKAAKLFKDGLIDENEYVKIKTNLLK